MKSCCWICVKERMLALFLLVPTTSLQTPSPVLRYIESHGGHINHEAIILRPSHACGGGTGVFAVRSLQPSEELAYVPLSACITARNAREAMAFIATDHSSDRQRQPVRQQAVLVAALLASVRWLDSPKASAARARWGGYVDSLPWSAAQAATEEGLSTLSERIPPSEGKSAAGGVEDGDAEDEMSRCIWLSQRTAQETAEAVHELLQQLPATTARLRSDELASCGGVGSRGGGSSVVGGGSRGGEEEEEEEEEAE